MRKQKSLLKRDITEQGSVIICDNFTEMSFGVKMPLPILRPIIQKRGRWYKTTQLSSEAFNVNESELFAARKTQNKG